MKHYSYILFILLSVALCSCYELFVFDGVPIRQYADKVIDFSSQYSATTWSAQRALGEENVYPSYGDISDAWASQSADANREFLVLGFETVQTVNTIQIYETYNPGAIDTVYLRNADTKKWNLIYSKHVEKDLPGEARIKSIFLVETHYFVDAIRIALNSPEITGWNEIDAVAITGQRKK
jgi:hypothetical protein